MSQEGYRKRVKIWIRLFALIQDAPVWHSQCVIAATCWLKQEWTFEFKLHGQQLVPSYSVICFIIAEEHFGCDKLAPHSGNKQSSLHARSRASITSSGCLIIYFQHRHRCSTSYQSLSRKVAALELKKATAFVKVRQYVSSLLPCRINGLRVRSKGGTHCPAELWCCEWLLSISLPVCTALTSARQPVCLLALPLYNTRWKPV